MKIILSILCILIFAGCEKNKVEKICPEPKKCECPVLQEGVKPKLSPDEKKLIEWYDKKKAS